MPTTGRTEAGVTGKGNTNSHASPAFFRRNHDWISKTRTNWSSSDHCQQNILDTADGSSGIIDGSSQPLSPFVATTSEHTVASQKLVSGGAAITISGTVMSLQEGGSSVVGGKTEALSASLGSSTMEDGLGGIIATIGPLRVRTRLRVVSCRLRAVLIMEDHCREGQKGPYTGRVCS